MITTTARPARLPRAQCPACTAVVAIRTPRRGGPIWPRHQAPAPARGRCDQAGAEVRPEDFRPHQPASAVHGVDTDVTSPSALPTTLPDGRPLRIAIDADCPACGKPERFYEPARAVFGCSSLGGGPCGYESIERDA